MHAWILALLVSLAPPGRVPSRETAEAGLERYGEIALAIETVATTEEPLFLGDRGRERTAALLVSVAFFESGLRRDIDEGTTRGDHGRACGLWQIQGAGVPCPELTADRANEATLTLMLMRRSFAACRAAHSSRYCSHGRFAIDRLLGDLTISCWPLSRASRRSP